MLLYLLYPLREHYSAFNVFKYITFRTFGASITAVVLCMLIGPWFIQVLKNKQLGQNVRSDGPKSHLSKTGTPTMGGILILASITISTLLWTDLTNKNVWICLGTTLCFGLIGFVDDYRKVAQKNSKGLTAKQKLFFPMHCCLCYRLCNLSIT